ncbi:MAG: orotate phosphoribosyltransferase [Alphaproteobacteria bacterium]|jgi:orotate phosphoribosyltransferase|nr:orotate phosphoribosyltransferase [Alphaproteobacteria bacterium]MDP6515615.1 orotate phosphoribosyltransferase [Alphaproteobacteria bacterium]|tara:strand:+ start:537 stop:1130 length:594 start_codon:yes stop_codon:yes gene_type:complete
MNLATARQESESQEFDHQLAELHKVVQEKSLSVGQEFLLAAGTKSRFYFNMKETTMDPGGSNLISDLILDAIADEPVDYIGGLEMGAVPIVACVSQRSAQRGRPIPAFFVRKQAKEHGTRRLIDRELERDSKVVIVDDVTTSGGSVLKAVQAVRKEGCKVSKVITVVDRLEGADSMLAKHDLELVALLKADAFDLTG